MSRPRELVMAGVAALGAASATSCSETGVPSRVTLVTSVTGVNCDHEDARFLTIGQFVEHAGYATTVPVIHEHADGNQTATVECTVSADADGYKVSADTEIVGLDPSIFKLHDAVVTTDPSAQVPVSVEFEAHLAYYEPKNCVLSYATPQQTVAPGTLWAQVACPNSPSADPTKRINGAPVACDIVTTARFEQCGR